MTLYIKVKSVQKLALEKGKIFIQGSQAGVLVTEFTDSNYRWENGFDIVCSKDDTLTFKVCKSGKTIRNQDVVATAQFYSPIVIGNNSERLNLQKPFEYSIDIKTFENKPAGIIIIKILYDSGQLYMGQLNEIKQRKQIKEKLVQAPLIKRKTQRNLAYFFDKKNENQNQGDSAKFIESIYRDE